MTIRTFLAVLFVALISACGGGGDDASTPVRTTPSSATPVPAGTAAPAQPAAAGADATGPLPQVKLQRLGNLTFRNMTGMYEVPGVINRYIVLEKPGRLMTYDANDLNKAPGVFMDIADRVDDSSSELGLLGLAFAPDFLTSRSFYVNYTAGSPLRTVVSRFTANPGIETADAKTEAKVIEIAQPYTNHNGGEIRFGPDGMLYLGMGDGGSGNDPQGNAQKRDALLGKMLRIDPSGTSSGRAYRIPPDNPFVGQQGTREEIWTLGMRNPWRFTFDKQTGTLWVGDVGQNSREEVDVIRKGANYGWNVMEGANCRQGNNCDKSAFVLPVIDYATADGNCAVVGGFIYRGEAIAALRGAYVYGDYCSGKVWALRYDGSKVTEQSQIAAVGGPMSSFAEDTHGELYALAYGDKGAVFKITP
jgi:glucose/arabinose dehydrogenase